MNLSIELKAGCVVVAFLSALCGWAKESTWTGAVDGDWGNPDNWSNGIPGMYKDADGNVVGDNETHENDDTAIFTSCTGATTIDLAKHVSIGNIVVRGADAPKFTFGTSSSQVLLIKTPSATGEANAHQFLVEDSVVRAPEIVATAWLAENRKADVWVKVVNNSSDTLILNDIKSQWTNAEFGGSAYEVRILLGGTGPISVNGVFSSNSNYVLWATRIYIGTAAGVTFNKSFSFTSLATFVENARVVIPEGVTLTASNNSNGGLSAGLLISHAGFILDGGGTIVLRPNNYVGCDNRTYKTTFNCRIGDLGSTKEGSGMISTRGIPFYRYGVFRLNGLANGAEGEWWALGSSSNYTVFETTKLGLVGEESPFGDVKAIGTSNGLVIRFVGDEDDVTDRELVIGKHKTYTIFNECVIRIEQEGLGTLTVNSPQRVTALPETADGCHTFCLAGTKGDGIWTSPIIDCEVEEGRVSRAKVVKQGSGTWTLAGTNTYSGATSIEAGTLVLGVDGALGNSAVSIKGGATFAVAPGAGEKSILSLLVEGGDDRLSLGDGAALSIASLTRTSGTLEIETEGSGSVRMTGLSAGVAPAWLTINGGSAEVLADGTLVRRENAWKNAISGLWKAAENWSKETVPDGSVLTTVSVPGTYTVTVDESVSIGAYEQKYANLDAAAPMAFSDVAEFGPGATATFGEGASATFDAGAYLKGARLEFSGTATAAVATGYFGSGEIVFADASGQTAPSQQITIAPSAPGDILSIVVTNSATFINSLNYWLYLGQDVRSGTTRFDYASSSTASLGYGIAVGRGNGRSDLTVSNGGVKTGNGGLVIGSDVASSLPETGTGVVKVVAGALTVSPQGHAWNSSWSGLSVGMGCLVSSEKNCLVGRLEVLENGRVSLGMSSLGIGIGCADGMVLQRGGAFSHASAITREDTRYMPVVVGYAGGVGAYVLSNGTLTVTASDTVHNKIFVGGCLSDDLNRQCAFACKVSPGSGMSRGLLAVRGGTMAAAQSDVVVGKDGVGIFELGGTGVATVSKLDVLPTGMLLFAPNDGMVSPLLTVKDLAFSDNAILKIDMTGLTKHKAWTKLAAVSGTFDVANAAVELTLPADWKAKDCEVVFERNGEKGIWFRRPKTGMVLLFR